nr:hypothetical protein A5888_002802 [Enterococcus sp. 9E7_DIV0242]
MQLVTSLEADEGLIGYSRYRNNELFHSNPFFYKGETEKGNQQQPNQVTKITSPSTKLADGSYFDTEMTVLSDNSNEMTVRIGLPIELKEINVDFAELTLEIGESKQLQATLVPENATDKQLTWLSSDEAIASVDETGKITAKDGGKTKVTAKNQSGSVSATCEVTVKEKAIAVEDIVINRNLSLMVGEEKKADFSLVPENASTKFLEFEIEDTSVAIVDESGIVTGKKNGQTKLTISTKDQLKKKELCVLVGDDYPNVKDSAEKIDSNKEYEGIVNYYNDEDWFEVERPADGSDLMIKVGRKGYNNLPTVVKEYQDMSGVWRVFPNYQTAPYASDENNDFFITLLSSIEYQKIRFNVKYTSSLEPMQEYTVTVMTYDQSKITKPTTGQTVYEVAVGETIQLDIENTNGFMKKVETSQGSSGKNSLFEFTEDFKVTGIKPGKY